MLAVSFCVAMPLTAMLPVLPVAATEAGGTAAAGVVTGAVAATTVAFELLTPRLLARWSARVVLIGSYLLSVTSVTGLALGPDMVSLVLFGLSYGVGLGVSATVASMLPAAVTSHRRESAFAGYGIVSALPAIIGAPAAVVALPTLGVKGVLLVCAGIALVGLYWASRVPNVMLGKTAEHVELSRTEAARVRSTLVAYGLISVAYGGVASFTAFHVDSGGLASAAAFFLAFGIARTACRGLAAPALARAPFALVTGVALVASTVGLTFLALELPALIVIAGLLFGAGYGALQMTSLLAALGPGGVPSASGAAQWNFVTDVGIGVGALALAPIAAQVDYAFVFALLPLIAVAAMLVQGRAIRAFGSPA